MDIQAQIAYVLSGYRRERFDPVDYAPGALPVISLGRHNEVVSPVKQYQFAVACNTNPSVALILKEFDIPAIGMTFSMEEDKLWFPVPRPNVPSATMTGYVWDITVKATLAEASLRQYRMGLLSTRKGLDFTVFLLEWEENSLGTVDQLGLATAAVQSILTATGDGPTSSAISSTPDIVSDTLISTQRKMFDLRTGGFSVLKLITLKNCRMSPPSFTASQNSNDFATVRIDVSYTKAKWLDGERETFSAPAVASDKPVY